MWTGVMLSLVLCQAKADGTVAKATNVSESRYEALEKEFFTQTNTLTFNGKLTGPAAKDAVKIGNLKVAEAADDQKNDLVLRKKKDEIFSMTSDQPEYRVIHEFERDRETKDNLRFSFQVAAAPRASKKVSVKGSVDLMSGTPATADFAKAKSLEGTVLKNADLDALKLKVTVIKPGKDFFGKPEQCLFLKVEGDERPIVESETVILDSAGKKIDGYSSWNAFRTPEEEKGKYRTLTINCGQNIPADGKLQIKFLKSPKVVTVPFEFKDVELP